MARALAWWLASRFSQRLTAVEIVMHKRTPWMFRQGDVMLVAVEGSPADARDEPRDASGRVVLAYGERTGHAHALHEPGVRMLRAANQEVFLEVLAPANLLHEEHERIAIPPGAYRVVRQREWTDEEEPMQVAD